MEWKTLESTDQKRLNHENNLHHQAIQFIALAGKYLLPDKEDDSHTSMIWNEALNSYTGNVLPQNRRVAVRLPDLSLCIYDEKDYVVQAMEMNGCTWSELYDWMEKALQANSIDTKNLDTTLHYEIPNHGIYETASFDKPDHTMAQQVAFMRSNARNILKDIVAKYPQASHIRIWPHHFDTGTSIPLNNEKGKMIASIGLGLAVADDMIDEPYFYVNHWVEKGPEKYPELPQPGKGKWIINDWKGSVLPLSVISKMPSGKEQHEALKTFFGQSIEITQQITGTVE